MISKTRAFLAVVLACVALPSMAAEPCRTITFETLPFTICEAEARRES